jgi:putative oxidoreductase
MIIVRTLMGLLFLFASIAVLFNLVPKPELTGVTKAFNEGLEATGYFMPVLKVTELICGLALVTGRFVPLALVVLAPIIINIFLFHSFIDRSGLPVAIFLVAGALFLAYYYRDRYKPLFNAV